MAVRTDRNETVVRVGSRVHIEDGSDEEWWLLVPAGEGDIYARCLSENSPLGQALLGHRAGDECAVNRRGRGRVTILDVETVS